MGEKASIKSLANHLYKTTLLDVFRVTRVEIAQHRCSEKCQDMPLMRSLSTREELRLSLLAGELRTCQRLQNSNQSDLHRNAQVRKKERKERKKNPTCESHPAHVTNLIKMNFNNQCHRIFWLYCLKQL